MLIQILGVGCPACRHMERDVREIVNERGMEVQIQRIKDPEAISEFGVFSIPALIIDGEVMIKGYSGKARIERVIREKLWLE